MFAQGLVVAFVIQKVGVGVGPLELVAAVHQQLTGLHRRTGDIHNVSFRIGLCLRAKKRVINARCQTHEARG